MQAQENAGNPASPVKLTDWVKEPTLQTLKADLEGAKAAHDAMVTKVKEWRDLMKITGKSKPVKVKGRSAVQPKLVRRQAEWRYSALSEPFLSADKLFSVKPTTFEDVNAASQNELVLNWQMRTKFNKIKFIDEFVRTTVDEGTSIIRTGWKRVTKTVKKTVPVFAHIPADAEEDFTAFEQVLALRESNPREYDESIPPELKASVDYYDETGEVTHATQTGTEEVDEEKIIENRPTADMVNPENFYLDPSCEGDITNALFAAYSFETNKAELDKYPDRYKNLESVNWESASPLTEPDHSTRTPQDFNFADKARKKVVAYEYWGFYDIHDDGELVPFVATWIGDAVIRMELNPFPDEALPFVLVPYLPVIREAFGEADAEMLGDNQAILGAVMRGMIDTMGRSANGQTGIAKGMLDPFNKRKYENGDDYEFNPSLAPQLGFHQHVYPELPQSALVMSQLQNQDAEALTGVKSFSGGLSGDAYGKVATNTRSVLDAASKREMSILRRMARGIGEVGTKFAAMNAEFLSEKEVVRVTNEEFVTVNREDLKGNFDLKVDISTPEVDNEKAQDLGFMLQTMGPNMDPELNMMILAEIATLKQMPALAKKLKDWKPTPDPMAEKMKELEIQKLEAENQKILSEVQLNLAKAEFERARKDYTDLEFVEQETGTKHARDLEQTKAQARGNQSLEVTKALAKPLKEGEKAPDIEAMLGYNQLSAKLEEAI